MYRKLKKRLTNIILSTIICASGCAASPTLPNNFELDPASPHRKKIAEVDTVDKAQEYCGSLYYEFDKDNYGEENYWASFKTIYKKGKDDCDGAAVAAAALLSDDGYPAKIICMYGKEYGHAIFLYEEKGKYGSIGINWCDNNSAVFDSVDELVRAIDKLINGEDAKEDERFYYYYILDFSKYIENLIEDDGNLLPLVKKVRKDSEVYYLSEKYKSPTKNFPCEE